MGKAILILTAIGIFIYWLICLLLQTPEEYKEIEGSLEEYWL